MRHGRQRHDRPLLHDRVIDQGVEHRWCPLVAGADERLERLKSLRREVASLLPPDLGGGDLGEFAATGAGRDAVDLFRRGRAAVLFLEGGNFLFDLRPSLRRHGAIRSGDADNLESLDDASVVARRLDLVAGREHAMCEFVLVNFAGVAHRREHFALGEGEPLVGLSIKRGVGGYEMRVQLGVEGARCVVLKARGAEVASEGDLLRPRGTPAPHASRRKTLQLGERYADRFVMCLPQPFVAECDRE